MEYAFISYSTKNQTTADTVHKVLENSGIKTWMAPGDIPPGEKYAGAINQAIKGCTCVVLLLSNDAQNSIWVAKEIERAINYRKTVIPVMLENVVLNDEFELYISTNQAIPLFDLDEDGKDMERVVSAVAKRLGITPSPQASVKRTSAERNKIKISDGLGGYYYGYFVSEDDITGVGEHLRWYDKALYTGDFVDSKFQGKGELKFENGDRYVGDFFDDCYHGKGELFSADGEYYSGDFANGCIHGKGKATWPNGDCYIGEIDDGYMHGRGEFTWANGDRYIGDFEKDERSGSGEMIFANGDRYVGDFVEGKFHGRGEYFYDDGRRFVGEFKDDNMLHGTYYDAHGNIIETV